MATSSALQLADLALTWLSTSGDLSLIDSDLSSDIGMETAVLLSLFTDRRAEDDDSPPSGDVDDRRGWWADQFAAVEGDRFGSRLWLLERSKRVDEVRRRAEEHAREALAWMIEDHVAQRIDVAAELTTRELRIAVTIHRPGREPVALRFAHVWTELQE